MMKIITLYDTYLENPALKEDFGFSCYVEAYGKRILFDTGSNSEILLYNMRQLKINPKDIDAVFISHNHWDHTGGLNGFLRANGNKARVIKPETFDKPTEIFENIYTTGYLNALFLKEQSLVVKTEKGLVIVTGCSHPGIINIIRRAKQIDERVYLVIGGFHHPPISVVNEFRNLNVEKVAPCHCTGDFAREEFRKEYKEDFIKNGVGKVIEI